MTTRDGTENGWVLHEPAADGSGWSGWLYHYPDGTVVTEDGSVVDADELDEADDPGWFLVDPATEGTPAARWLYEYADGTVVDDEGRIQVETPPVHLVAAPAVEADVDEEPEPATPSPVEPVETTAPPEPDLEPPPSVEPETTASPEPDSEPEPPASVEPVETTAPPEPERVSGSAVAAVAAAPLPAEVAATVGSPRRRGSLVVAAVLALVVVVAAAVVGVLVGRGTDDGGATATQAATRFDPPDAVPLDSEYVSSRVLSSGAVVVDHWVRTSRPFTDVVLRAPRRAFGGAGVAAARQVRVETASGRRSGPGALAGGSRAAYDGGPTTTLHVHYVLSGVVRRSLTVTDRALVLTSLDLGLPGTRLPRAVVVTGGRPLAAACAVPGAAAPRPCGNAEGRGWRVGLEPGERSDQVAVQVDLP